VLEDLHPLATHTFLDYLAAISTAVAALGTLAAVIVALYLNWWREARTRPQLDLAFAPDAGMGVGYGTHVKANEYEFLNHRPLTWLPSEDSFERGREAIDVPPGVTRKVTVLISGHRVRRSNHFHPMRVRDSGH
jgi:hypothetical protein